MTAVVFSWFICVCVLRDMCVSCRRFAPMCVRVACGRCACGRVWLWLWLSDCARASARVCAFTRARALARHCVRVCACQGLPVRLCGCVLLVVRCGAGWCCVLLCIGPRIPVSPFVCMVACMRVRGAAWRGVVWRGGGW